MKNDRPEQLPLARREQLIVKEVDDEVLVYDLKTDQAHCLNKTAGLVWQNCDGKKSVTEINACLSNETGAVVDEQLVWLALDELEEFKLMSQVPPRANVFADMSRRQLMRNMGIAAVALPMILSIVAPTAVSALSCVNPGGAPPGTTCTNKNQCCTDICSGGANKTCG